MLKVLIYALPIILAVYALVDLVQTDEEDVQGLPKLVWVLLIVLIWVIGPLAWLLAGRRGRHWLPGFSRAGGPGHPGTGRPTAPDDDPDFLRGLRYDNPPPPKAPDDDNDPPKAT